MKIWAREITTRQGVLDKCPSLILSWSSLRSELNMSSSPMYAHKEWYLWGNLFFSNKFRYKKIEPELKIWILQVQPLSHDLFEGM